MIGFFQKFFTCVEEPQNGWRRVGLADLHGKLDLVSVDGLNFRRETGRHQPRRLDHLDLKVHLKYEGANMKGQFHLMASD